MATLLFDLDGTLIDSAVGITRCVAHALAALDVDVPDDDALRAWIGPPLRTSFAPLLQDDARVELAVQHYRDRFEHVGWREHEVYPGIADAVATLADAGHRLAVVTAKNEPHARRILDHLPFGHVFGALSGATPDGRIGEKPELIAVALERLRCTPGECIMIGDRHMDIDGARHHGIASIGVLWGFGSQTELAHATALARTPDELVRVVDELAVGAVRAV